MLPPPTGKSLKKALKYLPYVCQVTFPKRISECRKCCPGDYRIKDLSLDSVVQLAVVDDIF
jgi:hypothetical protein